MAFSAFRHFIFGHRSWQLPHFFCSVHIAFYGSINRNSNGCHHFALCALFISAAWVCCPFHSSLLWRFFRKRYSIIDKFIVFFTEISIQTSDSPSLHMFCYCFYVDYFICPGTGATKTSEIFWLVHFTDHFRFDLPTKCTVCNLLCSRNSGKIL